VRRRDDAIDERVEQSVKFLAEKERMNERLKRFL
jgi:hypothetical protein